jgi:hypothetical protein
MSEPGEPCARCPFESIQGLGQGAHSVELGSIHKPSRLVVEHMFIKMAMQEHIIDVNVA